MWWAFGPSLHASVGQIDLGGPLGAIESYIFLHKNRTISRTQILKQLMKGEFDVPDECLGDAKEMVDNLYKEYTNLEDEIIQHYENLGEENIFEKIKIMFAMHNGKKYVKLIWNLIKLKCIYS